MDDKKQGQWQTVPGKEGVLYREHASRKNGRMPDRYLSIRYRSGGGKRTHETLGWTSEGWTVPKAVALLREIKENIRTGVRPQSLREKREMFEAAKRQEDALAAKEKLASVTFGELAEAYCVWCDLHRVSAAHVRRLLAMHILPEIGTRIAKDITSQDIAVLGAKTAKKRPQTGRSKNVRGATLSTQTVLHVLKTVREVYNYALETPAPGFSGMMLFNGSNPALLTRRNRALNLPKVDARRLRVLNDSEIKDLLNYRGKHLERAAEGMHDMVLLSLDTGLRAGELVSLKCEACDPETGAIRIITGAIESKRTTKGGKTRIVHAGRLFADALNMLRERLATNENIYLFPGRGGGAMHPTTLSHGMARMAKSLGINDGVTDPRNTVVWHTLRHTFATRSLESGIDIYALKVLMGHDSVTTTEGYLHLCDMRKRRSALAKAEIDRQGVGNESAEARNWAEQ